MLVCTDSIQSLRLEDGSPGWKQPYKFPRGALPSGLGIRSGSHFFVPLSNATVQVMDLESGEIASTIRTDMQVPLGNLSWAKGEIVSLGSDFLGAYRNLGIPAEQTEPSPRDVQSLRLAAELLLNAGNLDGAIDHLQQAYAVAPDATLRNLLIRLLLKAERGSPNNPKYSQALAPFLRPERKFGP